jgi:hypothetical protein
MQNGGEIGMPLAAFVDQRYAQLEKGRDQFAIGHAQEWLDTGFEAERTKLFQEQQVAVKEAPKKFVKS